MQTLTLFYIGLFVLLVASFAGCVVAGRMLKSQAFVQRKLPVFVTFVVGATIIVNFFIPKASPLYTTIDDFTSTWATIIASFAVTLGIANLLLINSQRIYKVLYGWHYNLVLILGFLITAGFGVVEGIGIEGTVFHFIFQYIYEPLNKTMFSILAFYVASAAFRAFRAKNSEATMLLVAAIVVMLGRVPIGTEIWEWLMRPVGWVSPQAYLSMCNEFGISSIANFINETFTTAGQRAILLGASLGYISFSIKILLGIERSYFGGEGA